MFAPYSNVRGVFGKTYGVLPILIDKATKTPNLEISVVSESIPHLRKGALKDFLKIMKETNRYNNNNYNRSFLVYTFSNGSYIEFFSADQSDKVHGPRRNILYVNECNNIAFETYHQLAIRSDMEIWLDFNPANEFWAYRELKPDEDTEWLTLTYKDNEGLSASIVKEIEKAKVKALTSKYWENWWKVYGLGELGSLEGVIFSNWEQIDTIPEGARFIGSGLDFGFSNDPTALIDIYEWDGKRILDERLYTTGMINSEIANRCYSPIVYADSAEPKSIEEISRLGVTIKAVTKGQGSILYGIQIMQGQKYLITSNSVNTIKEFRSYCWDTDKTGNKINKPIDAFNHAIDAIRYHEMESLRLTQKDLDIFVG